jgi:hypothetical protein
MKIVTVITGSGAFFLITIDFENSAKFFAAFVALWAVIDIVVSLDKKATLHADLTRGFTVLAGKIAAVPMTEAAYTELSAERLRLDHDDFPSKRFVDLHAGNDECRARGFPADDLVPLSKWQRRLGYYMTLGMERLEVWKYFGRNNPVRALGRRRSETAI